MKCNIGIWIDRRKAIIINPKSKNAGQIVLYSGAERHPKRALTAVPEGSFDRSCCQADDVLERRFQKDLHVYYDQIILRIVDYSNVLIFGPGEAKVELAKHISENFHRAMQVTQLTSAKLSSGEMAALVRGFSL
jgi:hypothetical protein